MQSRITHAMKTGDGEWEQTMLGTLRILGGKLPRNVPWRRCAIPAVQVDVALFGGMDMGSGSSPPKVQKGIV